MNIANLVTAVALMNVCAVGRIEISIVDQDAGKPLPCRIHLKDPAGKPRGGGDLPFWHDHFVCPGNVALNLPAGKYGFEVARGPEYSSHAASFAVMGNDTARVAVTLHRIADLAKEGWWSGELHIHRPLQHIELLMRAEDLHVAPVITWWNNRNLWAGKELPADPLVRFDGNRYYQVVAGEDERGGGALLYFQLRRPLAITAARWEYPSPLQFATEARSQPGVHIDIEKPFWWDMPIWLAGGQADTIGIANNHMCRSQMFEENEALQKHRDTKRLPAPLGNGFWSQEIYYNILNSGLRLPPSAGAASGVLPNPVGYDRVYVHIDGDLTYEKWWEGLRAGRSFVTNGPLLRVQAAGQRPGHVFTGPEGREMNIGIKAMLTSRDKVRALEVIKNGRVARSVPFDKWVETGSLGDLSFKESGWFLVRAIADNEKTLRFASTAPYYVEIGPSKRRVSKSSAQFFLDWVRERSKRVKLTDPAQRRAVLQHHEKAERFWEEMVRNANAE